MSKIWASKQLADKEGQAKGNLEYGVMWYRENEKKDQFPLSEFLSQYIEVIYQKFRSTVQENGKISNDYWITHETIIYTVSFLSKDQDCGNIVQQGQ